MWFPYENLLDDLRKGELETNRLRQHLKEVIEKVQNTRKRIEELNKQKSELSTKMIEKEGENLNLSLRLEDTQHRCSLLSEEIKVLEDVRKKTVDKLLPKSEELRSQDLTMWQIGSDLGRNTFMKFFDDLRVDENKSNALLKILAEKHKKNCQEIVSLIEMAAAEQAVFRQDLLEIQSSSKHYDNQLLSLRRTLLDSLMSSLDEIDSSIQDLHHTSLAKSVYTNEKASYELPEIVEDAPLNAQSHLLDDWKQVQGKSRTVALEETRRPVEKWQPTKRFLESRALNSAPKKLQLQPATNTASGSVEIPSASPAVQSKIDSFFPKSETKRFSSKARTVKAIAGKSDYFRMAASEDFYDDDDSMEEWHIEENYHISIKSLPLLHAFADGILRLTF